MRKPEIKGNLVTSMIIIILAVISVISIGQATVFYGHFLDFGKDIQIKDNEIAELKLELNKQKAEATKIENLQFRTTIFRTVSTNFDNLLKIVFDKSKKYAVDPYIIMSVIQVESNFDVDAQSFFKDGRPCAYGLMQINYEVWKDELKIDKRKIFEVEYNVDLGIRIFKHYLELSKNNTHQALFLYNNGPSGQYNNRKYAPKVLRTMYAKNGNLRN